MQRDYFTECGYRWEENEDGTLRLARQPVVADGAAVRTPMMFKDGKSHDQATRDAIAYECSAPGPACVFLDGAINPVTDDRDDPRIKAYRHYDARLANAWMRQPVPTTNDSLDRLQQQRDQAIRDGRHEEARELSYRLYDQRLATAWQRKGP
jgi:hypothetical protein